MILLMLIVIFYYTGCFCDTFNFLIKRDIPAFVLFPLSIVFCVIISPTLYIFKEYKKFKQNS